MSAIAILKTLEAFKDVRARGNDVIAVPLNPADMEITESKSNGFGITANPKTEEEAIRFVAVAVGSGEWRQRKLLPLDFSAGDIFITALDNEAMRSRWKEDKTTVNGHRMVIFSARTISSESGSICAIFGRI